MLIPSPAGGDSPTRQASRSPAGDGGLTAATGSRQALAVVLRVRLLRAPDWAVGPFPFPFGGGKADAGSRSTYFTRASARVLYGTHDRPSRWYRPLTVEHDGLLLRGVELLRTASTPIRGHALAVLHFDVHRPLLPVLRAIGRRPGAEHDPLTGPFALEALLDDVAEVPSDTGTAALARRYTVALLVPGAAHAPALRPGPDAYVPPTADQWLWQLASRSTPADFPLAPEAAADQYGAAVRLSADWSALVLRDGAAFLGHRADTGPGDFYDSGELHSRSVYLDALLLGSLQRDHIGALADELSRVFEALDGVRLAHRVGTLERNIARFRSTYWRQHLTAHGPANDLLLAFQAQHGLSARFADILAEAADVSRLVQTQESQQISAALGVLTVLGLPLGTALGILQVLGDQSVRHLFLALALALVTGAAALTTRYGRLVLSSLRGSGGPHRSAQDGPIAPRPPSDVP